MGLRPPWPRVAVAIPWLPGAAVLGFVHLPPLLLLAVTAITVAFVAATGLLKLWFYRRAAR